VALVAALRKLVTTLNVFIKTDEFWDPDRHTAAAWVYHPGGRSWTSLTHHRPGDPLKSCVPAALFSVWPDSWLVRSAGALTQGHWTPEPCLTKSRESGGWPPTSAGPQQVPGVSIAKESQTSQNNVEN